MTLKVILESTNFINDNSIIFIRNDTFQCLTKGHWYEDKILNYLNYKIESFTWQDDNKIYINI